MGDAKIPGDGVIIGYGKLNDRLMCVFAHDFTVFGGTIAETGFIDEIIQPHETRPKLICALESLKNKNIVNEKRKHGNIPL